MHEDSNSFHLSSSANTAIGTLTLLREMQQTGELCDVLLSTESGGEIPAHRAVLAASSPFFRGMFAADLAEKNKQDILLKEIDFDILQVIVAAVYNAEVTLPKDRVRSLLSVADLFQIQHIFDSCCTFLQTQIKPSNCLGLAAFADLHHCEQLNKMCTDFALKHFEEVISFDEFLSLPCHQLKELISRDDIQVASEEIVYNAVVLWVYHDLETRRETFASVMSHVRLPFVSTDFLSNSVEQEDLMLSEERCKGYIHEAVLYKSSPEKRPTLKNSPRAKPRKLSGLQNVILTAGGMGRNGALSVVERFDLHADTWFTLEEMDGSYYGLAACFLDGCLYTTGGCSNTNGSRNTVQRYNLKTANWRPVQSMNHPRSYHCCGVLYGLLYSVGGTNSESVVSSVERYDPAADEWTFVQPMIDHRMYHGLAELDGYLFSVGGHNGWSRLQSVEFYDPARDQWTFACSLSMPRSVAGVARLGGSIYVVGGYDGTHYLNSVECYDIELNKWLPCPSLGTGRSAFGLVSYNGSLFACGGFNGSFLRSVERLVLNGSAWEPCVAMETSKVHFGISCT